MGNEFMNQTAILLIISGVVISGCSEAVDSTYNVPTLHLVVDTERSSESRHTSCIGMVRYVEMDCHIQSDRPVEHDTYVLVNAKDGNVKDWGHERLKFVAILAGETQSKRLSLSVSEWDVRSNAVPKVVVTLPPAHERATLLPRKISYTDAMGQNVEKDLLVEYPFNPYNVGSPMEIRVEWREGDEINGPRKYDDLSEIHGLLTRWEARYETEDFDAYMSVFGGGFTYVADMGTPNNLNDDVKWGYRDERDSAIRVFSLYRNIQIELDDPPEVELDESQTRAEVRTHYEITGFVADGVSLEGGRDSWYAEGEFLFVLQKELLYWGGECVWRITEWLDKAVNKEGIDKEFIRTKFAIVKKF